MERESIVKEFARALESEEAGGGVGRVKVGSRVLDVELADRALDAENLALEVGGRRYNKSR